MRVQNRLLLISAVRVIFFFCILLIVVIYQIRDAYFFNTESILPLYGLLVLAFLVNTVFLFFFDKMRNHSVVKSFMFLFDALFISGLIYVTGVQHSIFLFLYLVNIILSGFVFQRRGAFFMALFTSACFSSLLILTPEIQGQTLYFAVGLNNLAFFAVAYLSGYLSELLNFMGAEINVHRRDILALKDLNKIIVENISSGLMTLSQTHEVILCNKAAIKILDWPKTLKGMHINQIFPQLQESIESKSDGLRFEKKYETPRGVKMILGFSVSKIENGFILIFQDLTEIRRLEESMRRNDKLAAVGKLAAGIAHEIRNPLASISGSIELLKSNLNTTELENKKLMDITLREINRLNLLITEFLDYVRPQEKKFEPCDLDSILQEVLDMVKLNKNLPTNVEQKTSLSGASIVLGDKNKLKQVFLNLIINAYQAMTDRVNSVVSVSTDLQNNVVTVRIKDTGHGMSEATVKRLFEPFFTTKAKGTGLGLATVHKILEIHGAQVFVESHEGVGTEFTIQLSQYIKEGAKFNESQNTGS